MPTVPSPWRDLPEPARSIAEASGDACHAARAADPVAYDEATTRLAALDPEQVGAVTGATARLLLEDTHPDGLTADDLRAVLTRCVRHAAAWYTGLDPEVPGMLIAGALGIHESDGERLPLTGPAVAAHAPLLLTALAAGAEHPLDVYLRAALADMARSETMESP